jgi:hypothetical protein
MQRGEILYIALERAEEEKAGQAGGFVSIYSPGQRPTFAWLAFLQGKGPIWLKLDLP